MANKVGKATKAVKTADEVVDYSSDIASLGKNNPKFTKPLNERISQRSKDFYLHEQTLNREAKELVKDIKLPISDNKFKSHIINGEIKKDQLTGGHTTLGDINIENITRENMNGVYEAKVYVVDKKTNTKILKISNDGKSTMFPRTWSEDRIKVEIDSAFKNAYKVEGSDFKWRGVSRSGVSIEWINRNGKILTIYPTLD